MKTINYEVLIRVPEWAKWIAQSGSGEVIVFENRPTPTAPDDGELWWDHETSNRRRQLGETLLDAYNFDIEPKPGSEDNLISNWRETLRRIENT